MVNSLSIDKKITKILVFFFVLFFQILISSSDPKFVNGEEWSIIYPPYSSSEWFLNSVYFTTYSEGWAVGRDVTNKISPLLYYLGGTWTSVPPPSVSSDWWLTDIYMNPPWTFLGGDGWAIGYDAENRQGLLLRYLYPYWSIFPSPSVSENWWLEGIHLSSYEEGWAVGYDNSNKRGVLLHYLNGNWTSVLPPSVSSDWRLYGVHFPSSNEGWAAGHDLANNKGILLHYLDGVWSVVNTPEVSSAWGFEGKCIYFTSSNEGWAVGRDFANKRGIILHYLNGSWTNVTLPEVSSNWRLWSIYFTSPSEGWAAGYDIENQKGVFLHYSSGSWALIPSPNLSSGWAPFNIYFVSPGQGWVVGEDHSSGKSQGLLIKYINEFITPPTIIKGPVTGKAGNPYQFATGGASSSLGHPLEYQFDWKGDGTDLSPWGFDNLAGVNMNSLTQTKTWTTPGIYNIRTRARCIYDTNFVSDWSETLTATITLEGDNSTTRTLPEHYIPSWSLQVMITVTPKGLIKNYIVEDIPPTGWIVTNINENGIWDSVNHKVKWGPFYDNNNRTLIYQVTPPINESGTKVFAGRAIFDGIEMPIGGDIDIELKTSHPADLDNNFKMFVGEVTTYGSFWREGQVWPVPPNPIPIAYVTNSGYLWKMGGVYHYDSQIDPPWVAGPSYGKSPLKNIVSLGIGTGVRTLPNCYTPSIGITVSILVTPGAETKVYAVEDNLPEGWIVSEINENGAWDNTNKKVKWGPFFDNNIRMLSYKLIPPLGETGMKIFSGIASFDGTNFKIGGQSTLEKCLIDKITLKSPRDSECFDSCSLFSIPTFSWTSEETFKKYEIQFSLDQTFSSIPLKIKSETNEKTIDINKWKKILLIPGGSGGTIYWRVIGIRQNNTMVNSETRSFVIESPMTVGNPSILPTSKSALPTLSWNNNCNTKFKVWFGSDEVFTKRTAFVFNLMNPNDNGGIFTRLLTDGQWIKVRKLIGDVTGSSIYWYVEAWDGLKRYSRTQVMRFTLID